MGVYIPNMKKERYCEECPLSGTRHIDIYDYVFCELLDEYVDEAKKHCPLIEISETKYHNMVVALDILKHEQNDCIEAERRADGDI